MGRAHLIAETPNAADGTHRYLASPGHRLRQPEIERLMQKARYREVGEDYVAVSRQVRQVRTGRQAEDLLVLGGLDVSRLRREGRLESTQQQLSERVRELPEVVAGIDWRGTGTTAEAARFGGWLHGFDVPVARGANRRRLLPGLALVVAGAVIFAIVRGLGPSSRPEEASPARSAEGPPPVSAPSAEKPRATAGTAAPAPEDLADRRLRRDYRESMADDRFLDAARLLVNNPAGSSRTLRELREDFTGRVLELSRLAVEELNARRRWADAYGLVSDLRRVPGSLQPESHQQALDALEQDVQVDHDRTLYRDARKSRQPIDFQTYLEEAPLKTMAASAKPYLAYLEKVAEPLPLTFILYEIDWAADCTGEDYKVTLYLDGKQVAKRKEVSSRGCRTAPSVASFKSESRISDNVTLRVKLSDSGFRSSSGESIETLEVSQWNGHTLDVLDGDGHLHRAFFKVHEIPVEPPLPEWSE